MQKRDYKFWYLFRIELRSQKPEVKSQYKFCTIASLRASPVLQSRTRSHTLLVLCSMSLTLLRSQLTRTLTGTLLHQRRRARNLLPRRGSRTPTQLYQKHAPRARTTSSNGKRQFLHLVRELPIAAPQRRWQTPSPVRRNPFERLPHRACLQPLHHNALPPPEFCA